MSQAQSRERSLPARREAQDGPPIPQGPTPGSVQIASRGLRTTADISDFCSALVRDVMVETVGDKTAGRAISGVNALLRSAEFQLRHGGAPVSIADPDAGQSVSDENDALARRRARILEELAALDRAEAEAARNGRALV